MRLARLLLGLSLLTLAAVEVPQAFAKKNADTSSSAASTLPKIEMTGITEFDSVFSKAKTIQDSLDTAYTELTTSRTNLNTSLGVATDAPLKTALEDLKTKANGKISVAMDGAMPSLKVADDAPENVKTGVTGVNGVISSGGKAVTTAKDLVPQTQELVSAVTAFPAQVKNLASDPMAAIKALKVVTSNSKAITGFPGQITAITGEVEAMFSDIKAAFSS